MYGRRVLQDSGKDDDWLRDQSEAKKRTHRDIACELKCSSAIISLACKRLGVGKQSRPSPQRLDLVGRRVGLLVVNKYLYTLKKETFWACSCACGREYVARGKHIKKERIQSCGCGRKKPSPQRTGCGELPGRYVHSLRMRAVQRGWVFAVTAEQLWKLFLKQNRRCALSGELLVFPLVQLVKLQHTQTASVDRIDSTKGYTLDNVQWVHKHINYLKQDLSNEAFIEWCRKVSSAN